MNKILLLTALTGLTACQPAAVDQAAELDALMRTSKAWSDVSGTGDIEAELSYWADDAVFMPPGADFLEGKAAIRAFLEQESALENFSVEWTPRSGYVAASGDIGYLVEVLRLEWDDAEGNRVSVPGKILTVWRKSPAGEWENIADSYNFIEQ